MLISKFETSDLKVRESRFSGADGVLTEQTNIEKDKHESGRRLEAGGGSVWDHSEQQGGLLQSSSLTRVSLMVEPKVRAE